MYIDINKIRKLRIAMHISKAAFAKKIGISRMYLTKIENNQTKPSLKVLLKISKELKICPYELLDLCTYCLNEKCLKSKNF